MLEAMASIENQGYSLLQQLGAAKPRKVITTGGGSQIINSGAGDDIIVTSTGADIIAGGAGNDTMTGGTGADTFKWYLGETGSDVITDFTVGDKLDFSGIASITGSSAALSNTVTANSVNYFQSGLDTIVWADTDGNTSTVELQVTLSGVTASSLSAASFIF